MAIVASVVAMLVAAVPAQAQGGPSMTIGGTASPASYSAIGDKISYSYTVTNTGSVLLNSYGVTDSRGTVLTCTTTTLAPATSAMCTGTYTVTAADIATVYDLNTIATLRATPATGTIADDFTTTSVKFVRNAAFGVSVITDRQDFTAAGQTINYAFPLTNTGNINLHLNYFDSTGRLVNISCPQSGLPVGNAMVCLASYKTTAADVTARAAIS
ncbi:MAG: hypothetical protein ABL874_12675, partial [Sphingopyxis sp.]